MLGGFVVGFAIGIIIDQSYKLLGVDAVAGSNAQELIAQGMACGAAGFVGGFATDGSLSKTSVADAAGQRTQMASLINALFVLLTMLFLASLFANLPSATLGAVVIDAMLGVITFEPMRRYFHH